MSDQKTKETVACTHKDGLTKFGTLVRCDRCGDVVEQVPAYHGTDWIDYCEANPQTEPLLSIANFMRSQAARIESTSNELLLTRMQLREAAGNNLAYQHRIAELEKRLSECSLTIFNLESAKHFSGPTNEPRAAHPFGNGHRATLDKAIGWANKYGGDGDKSDLQEIRLWLGADTRITNDPPAIAANGNIVAELLALVEGKCPKCGGDDLHSASTGGKEAISCCECEYMVTYESLKARARAIAPNDSLAQRLRDRIDNCHNQIAMADAVGATEIEEYHEALIAEIELLLETDTAAPKAETFQDGVHAWMMECFGPDITIDPKERSHRYLEESLELVQACGCTKSEALQLIDYVYGRPAGDIAQEIGGVMVTLAALSFAFFFDMKQCGDRELARVWTVIDKIREKQKAKPRFSPLPEAASEPSDARDAKRWRFLCSLTSAEWVKLSLVADNEIDAAIDDMRMKADLSGHPYLRADYGQRGVSTAGETLASFCSRCGGKDPACYICGTDKGAAHK